MAEIAELWGPLSSRQKLRTGEYVVSYRGTRGVPSYRRVAFWDGWQWRDSTRGAVIREPDRIYRPDDGPIWEALRG